MHPEAGRHTLLKLYLHPYPENTTPTLEVPFFALEGHLYHYTCQSVYKGKDQKKA